jgi:hypothetical protein
MKYAFPSELYNGMTLRDYFAAHVLQAYCSIGNSNWTMKEIAADAYSQADAMLKAREIYE